MEPLFLLSGAPAVPGHRLIRSVMATNPILAFVKNCEDLEGLQRDFSDVIWIVYDISRDVDMLDTFLKNIPAPDYIVGFDGARSHFTQTALYYYTFEGRGGIPLKQRERGHPELTLEGIVKPNDAECRILVNVVEKRSELKTKAKKVFEGTKNILGAVHQDVGGNNSAQDSQPLLGEAAPEDEVVSPKSCFSVLFSFCCPWFSSAEPERTFQSPQELRLQMRSEQLAEIREAFKNLHKTYMSNLSVKMLDFQESEAQQLEKLDKKVDDFRMRRHEELTTEKEKQNATTRERTSDEKLIQGIEKSRVRQTEGTVKHEGDCKFREGQSRISEDMDNQRIQFCDQHHLDLVEEQLKILTSLKCKYEKKTNHLLKSNFGTS